MQVTDIHYKHYIKFRCLFPYISKEKSVSYWQSHQEKCGCYWTEDKKKNNVGLECIVTLKMQRKQQIVIGKNRN